MISHIYDGVALTPPASVQLVDEQAGFTARAVGVDAATIEVIVDDASGALDFVDYKTWRIKEDTAPAGNQIMWAGFVGDQAIGRGQGTKFPTGTGRRWVLQLHEVNEVARRRVLRTGANRLSETVSARGAWLLTAVGFTGGLIVDHGLIEASSVVMDPFDYTNQYGADVLNSMAVACGYTPHIRYREASDDYELIFLDYKTSGLDTSALKISNVPADIGYAANGVWPANDATLRRSRERRWSGGAMPYAGGGSVYRQRAATQAVIGDVDGVFPANDVKTAETATTLTDRLLEQQAESEETVDASLFLAAANVNDVKQGQLCQVKQTYFPTTNRDWTAYVYCRVLERTVRRVENLTQAGYGVDLKLVPTAPGLSDVVGEALLRGPNDANKPAGHNGTFDIYWDGDGDEDNPPGGCSLVPLAGPFAYVGAVDEYTGIQANGWGSVLVDTQGTFSGSTAGGTITLTARILKNGGGVDTVQQQTSGGARAINWTWVMNDVAVAVASGDIISVNVTVDGMNPGDILVIPAGVGSCDNLLWVRGTLIA